MEAVRIKSFNYRLRNKVLWQSMKVIEKDNFSCTYKLDFGLNGFGDEPSMLVIEFG